MEADNDATTTTLSPSVTGIISTLAPDTTVTTEATTLTTKITDEVNDTTKSPIDGEDKDQAGTAKPGTKPDDGNETEEPDDGLDSWGDDSDDEKNIVDQMRTLREKDQFIKVTRNVSHLNETFDRMRAAWEIIDNYYLPEKQTWEKLFGLVTSLKLNLTTECFASYFSGVSGFRSYAPWAYRCMSFKQKCFLFTQFDTL